ncbi:MAG: hypothetical protein COY69_02275 [Candidatus Magasanikbacteria bacterium CG_4_10_14_0_8_um_filter_32_14]|uniref:Uncharacterized protein n=2 Tax=Candidatus Magasanikiibacteriota TaxID=1752731 RepID=A0A2M7R983_9BACT|nr:MAG: hypothetical protein AUJ23_02965 [Candidatus Magasanikbacteria bacterium CG1_02_32_51]PIY93329.1 MAG: hypothetical protein COY69_02275 [Candidatus Magasanikbacteria bacterium CG_4_10_14_0_8_um_filter_32_14]
MTLQKANKISEKNNPWYVTDEKFNTYWVWHGLFNSNDSIKHNKNFDIAKKQSSYLKKQIVINYFKNFFLFPILLVRLLTPWYLKGENNVWTNIKTILKSKEFKPLRFAILSQIIFLIILCFFGYIIFYKYSQLTKAAENGMITSTISEVNLLDFGKKSESIQIIKNLVSSSSAENFDSEPIAQVSLILSNGDIKKAQQQVHLADQKIDELEAMSLIVNQNLDYNQIVSLVSASQAMMLDIENNKDVFFQGASSQDVNNLFVRAINHIIRREFVLNKIAVNVNVILDDEQKNNFVEFKNSIFVQAKQFLDDTLNDSRFVNSEDYLERVRKNIGLVLLTDREYIKNRTDLINKIYSGDTTIFVDLEDLDKNFQEYFGYNFHIFFNTYTSLDTFGVGLIVERGINADFTLNNKTQMINN